MADNEQAYNSVAQVGVVFLAIASLTSFIAVCFALALVLPRNKTYKNTNILGYFFSLLAGNLIQSFGTAMTIRWLAEGGVFPGVYCTVQGTFKQAGNVANAVWSLVLSIHLFNLLFLRFSPPKFVFYATLFAGWFFVILIVIIGPIAIQTPQKGPYFGVSGNWCWITDGYHKEQISLEYLFEYLSAGMSFFLYTFVLLRVRGNLTIVDRRFRLRFVPRGQSWQLSIGRDLLDTSMLRVVQQMVWHPIAYSILIIPIGTARLSEFAGTHVPQQVTIFTAIIFNLTGLVNVLLIIATNRLFPSTHTLPQFNTPRQQLRLSTAARYGITPFVLTTNGGNNNDTSSDSTDGHSHEDWHYREKDYDEKKDDVEVLIVDTYSTTTWSDSTAQAAHSALLTRPPGLSAVAVVPSKPCSAYLPSRS